MVNEVLSRSLELMYILVGLLFILLAYVVPYSLLYSSRGCGLLVFWFSLTMIMIVFSIIYVRKTVYTV